jgi:hypothetical protein
MKNTSASLKAIYCVTRKHTIHYDFLIVATLRRHAIHTDPLLVFSGFFCLLWPLSDASFPF